MPWGTFKLAELNLDLQNVRTGPQLDQRAAMHALIEDQKQKLVNLAIDLLDVGPSPGEPIWVTDDPDEPGRQVVLEGNRRVCALKLMENPRLAEGTEVATQFGDLAKEFATKPIRTMEAALFVSRQAAKPFIDRRHMGATSGVGLQPWRALAKERSQPGWSGRVRRSLLALDYLDDDTDEFGEVGAVIEAKSTTVDRVLNNPAMKEVLGVNIDPKTRSVTFENGDEIAGRRLLRDVIGQMARPDFKFSEVRDEKDRGDFIRTFADRSVRRGGAPAPAAPPAQPSTPPPGGTVVPFRGRVPTVPPRPTLAPGGSLGIAKVNGDRLKRLYRECRQIKLEGNENAAALLLRVFIELSSEALLSEKNVTIPQGIAKRGITDWSEIGITLSQKVNAVLGVIDTSPKTKQQLQKVRVALDPTSHATGSVTTLHGYFHNLHMTPTIVALREAWDTWENYLRLLHAARV